MTQNSKRPLYNHDGLHPLNLKLSTTERRHRLTHINTLRLVERMLIGWHKRESVMKRFALTVLFCLLTISVNASEFEDIKALAEQGNADAQCNLGLRYYNGKGVPQYFAEAYVWESLAAASGHEEAIIHRDNIAAQLSPAVLDAAQKRAAMLSEEIQQRKAEN